MDEKPRSIWKKSWRGSGAIYILSFLIAVVVFLSAFIYALANWEKPVAETFTTAALAGIIFVACCLSIIYVVLPLSRWLFWKHWRQTLFGLVCFVTLIALFCAEEDWRGKHDWEKFKREWEANGEKFNYASIIPPAVPDDQNFAMAPIFDATDKLANRKWRKAHQNQHGSGWDTNVVDQLQIEVGGNNYNDWPTNGGNWQLAKMADLKEWQNYYRTLAAKTNEFPIAPQPQTPAQDVLRALSKYDSTIEELRQASQLPYSRFPLDYDDEDPAEILLPHLAALERCIKILRLRAIAESQNDESEKALDDVKLSLRLMDSIRTEPFLISHLVRVAILQITLQPIYESLAEHEWSDAQLAELDSDLAKLDFLADYKLSMRGEMVFFQGGIFDYLRQHPAQLINLSSDFGVANPPLPGRIVCWLIPTGWFYQNQLNCARPMVEFYVPAADVEHKTISPAKIRAADAAVDAYTKRPTPNNFIERMLLSALGASAKKFAYAQSSVNLARMAIALERYRLAHGEFPESLDALAPQFMGKIPHDIINGEPLHYRRTDDGQFILYSVGWNETDDGGVVGLNKNGGVINDQGDWVWRYPQK